MAAHHQCLHVGTEHNILPSLWYNCSSKLSAGQSEESPDICDWVGSHSLSEMSGTAGPLEGVSQPSNIHVLLLSNDVKKSRGASLSAALTSH